MHTFPTAHPSQVPIKTDYDVVIMRQHVRHLARDLGLALSQQAKIATAISTVARALVVMNCSTTIWMRTEDISSRPALVLTCSLPVKQIPNDLTQLEHQLQFGAARALVDGATIRFDGNGALLSLHMWLSR
jgi:hypothetical protein